MPDKRTILAVDDTTESLELLVRLLSEAGYDVRPADSGELALAAVSASLPDLILLGVRIQGLDGLEVCRRLKAREDTRQVPIILVSVGAEVAELVEGLRLGAADYITKPFQPEELLTRVKTHLALRQALTESERFLASTLDGLSSHIAVIDASGEIVLTNKAYREFAARNGAAPRSVAEGSNYLAVCDAAQGAWSEEAASFGDAIRQVLSGSRSSFEREYACHSPDKKRWFVGRVTPHLGDGSRRAIVAHEDVTERRQAEEALRESEKKYRQIVETAGEGVWVIDAEGRTTFANQKMAEMLGYSVAELLGASLFSFLDEAGKVIAAANLERRRRGSPEQHAVKFRRKDGTDLWGLFETNPILDRNGRYAGALAMITDITARQQLELEKQKFFLLVESSSEFIGMCDLDMQPFYVNPAGRRMVGLPDIAAACQVKVQDYYFPEDQGFIRDEFFPRVLREGQAAIEIRLRHFQTGEPIWMFACFFAVRDTSNQAIGWAIVSRDITERKQAEEAVRKSEERYRRMVETAREGVWAMDRDHRTTFVNAQMAVMLGYEPGEILGRTVEEFMFPEDLLAHQQRMDRRHTGQGASYEHRFRRRDGRTLWTIVSATALTDAQGQFDGSFAMFTDITARKQAEARLRSENAWSEAIINAAPNIIVGLGEGSQITIFNRFAEALTGFKADEVLGKPWIEVFIPPAQRAELYLVWDQIVADCLIEHHYENPIATRTGEQRLISWNNTVLQENGQFRMVLSIGEDITERKQAEEKLRESERSMRMLAESSPSGIWRTTMDGSNTYVNEGWTQITGIPSDQARGSGWNSGVHPEDRESIYLGWIEAARNPHQRYQSEFRFVRPDQSVVWVLCQARAERNDEGVLIGWVGTISDITERKQVEEALRKSEEAYRNLLSSLTAGVVVHAPDTSVLMANLAASRMLGLSEDQMFGKQAVDPQWKFLREDGSEMPLHEYPVNMVLSTREPLHNLVVGINRPQMGDIAWVLVDGFPVFKNSEAVERVIICFVDITERKQAEEALRASERRFELVIEGSQAGYWDWDMQTGDVYRNARWAEMLGYTLQEIEFNVKQWSALQHPDDREIAWRSINDHLEGRTPTYRAEYRMRAKDGQYKWILDQAKIVERDAQGKPLRMSGTHMDITERKQAEAERERLMLAIGQATEAVVITDAQGMIQYVNPAFERITGYTRQEAIGRNPRILKSGEHDIAFYRDMWETLKRGESWTGRIVNRRKDGTLYTEEAAISPVRDVSQKTISYVAVQRDVTSELALETELHQAQKMESVGRLAGGVAHDFNNMLGVILGYAEVLLADIDSGHPFYAGLTEIQKAARRSADLTRQLLAFARKQTVAPKLLDLNETIAATLKMLQRMIGEDIEMAWSPGEKLWPVKIDPGQIDQILTNLCVNARDAIGGVGKVTMETANAVLDEAYCAEHRDAAPGEYVLLAVSDNGCGMDAATLGHLFEPFFTTKEVGQGTGLGLATVYGAVKQNRGHLNVSSELGAGTTFKIYLPRHRDKTDRLPDKERETTAPRGRETILLVEDESAILRLTALMLQREGYTVVSAGTPGEAIRLANEHAGTIHLLMSDVVMPEMNGRELAKSILSLYPGVKCLFMSGYTADVIAHRGVLHESVNFIQKPFSRKELAGKLREVLDRH